MKETTRWLDEHEQATWQAYLASTRLLEEKAPGHVAEVRSRMFDRLSPEQVSQLREICETILDGLDTSDCPTTAPGTSAVH